MMTQLKLEEFIFRITTWFLVTILLLPLSACGLSGETISVQVVDISTGKPVPNAVVVVRWKGHVSAIVDSQTVCVHVLSAITDEQGNSRFQSWRKPSKIGPVFDLHSVVTVHKAGYQWPNPYGVVRDQLVPFTGTREERLRYLRRVYSGTGCHSAGESEENLSLLLKTLYNEAKGIAKTDADKKIVEDLLTALETVVLGYEQAEKRHLQRIRNRQ